MQHCNHRRHERGTGPTCDRCLLLVALRICIRRRTLFNRLAM